MIVQVPIVEVATNVTVIPVTVALLITLLFEVLPVIVSGELPSLIVSVTLFVVETYTLCVDIDDIDEI